MAKAKFTAIHRIMVSANPLKYIEPKSAFMWDEDEGNDLVRAGAASKGGSAEVAEEKAAPAKKAASAKKAAPAKTEAPAADADDGGDDDLV